MHAREGKSEGECLHVVAGSDLSELTARNVHHLLSAVMLPQVDSKEV